MKIRMKRFLSILLSLVMVLGLMPGMSLTAQAVTDDDISYIYGTGDEINSNYLSFGDLILPGTEGVIESLVAIQTEGGDNRQDLFNVEEDDGNKIATCFENLKFTTIDVDGKPVAAIQDEYDDERIWTPVDENGNSANSFFVSARWESALYDEYEIIIVGYHATLAESVTLNKESANLDIGSSETLTATVAPDNAILKDVIWSSSDTSVATVDENGKITGLTAGTATITATAKAGGETASCDVTVNETQQQSSGTDVLTREDTGRTGATYGAWSGVTKSSGAIYAGQSAGDRESIQLRSNNNNSGIVTTTSGGKATKVSVMWNSNTTNGRTLNVYGKNSAYSAASDLYGSDKGDLLGTIVCGQSTELTISGDYTYIGMRSSSGAMYLDSITIEWGGSTPATVAVTGVTLNPSTAQTIDVDNKVSFTATVDPDNATDKKVKWSVGGTNSGAVKLYSDADCTTEVGTDATSTLTVYAKGISAGSATVTATSNADSTKTASCEVTAMAQSEASDRETPLTLEAEDGTAYVELKDYVPSGMQVSKDGGKTKTALQVGSYFRLNKGETLQFYGKGTDITTYFDGTSENTLISISQKGKSCYVYGNIMSLVDEEGFATKTELTGERTFHGLFAGNANLCNHPTRKLILPATRLTNECYSWLFKRCTSLTEAPALPATTLAENCYSGMFRECKSLTEAPTLPATKLVKNCYGFMFYNCTKLNSVTCLATDISAEQSTDKWLENVASSGTFTKPSSMGSWTTNSESGIPQGWTTNNYVGVTGVTLKADDSSATSLSLNVDDASALTASVEPANATDKKVKWSVGGTDAGAVTLYTDEACTEGNEVGANATDVLTVYAKGISAGTATVTATSNADSNKSASCDVTVNAASEDPYAALKNTTNVITFDSKDWYLIDYDSSTVTLLSKECVAASQYNSSGSYVEYASSTVKTAVDNYYTNSISSNVKTAIVDNKMFLLTTDQANTIMQANPEVLKCNKANGADDNAWWLCSSGGSDSSAACVYGGIGSVDGTGGRVRRTLGVRPALKLDLSKVTFDSESRTFATAAPALDPVPYMAWDETSKTVKDVEGGCTDYTVVTDSTAAFEDGKWYVVNGEVSVASRITVTGTTNIILCDGAKLNANEGIALTSGKTLNIYGQSNGTGELTARGGEKIAGIGGGNKEHAGNVTIHGGVVYANGGTNGAGIGGGNEGNGGNVTINGGKVYATGGTNGAGIGGGNYANGGIVTVNGGTVDAKTIGNTSATSIGNGTYKSNAGSLIVASTHVAYSSNSPITAANKTSATAVQGSGAAMNIARQHYMLVEEGTLPLDPVSYLAWDDSQKKLVEKKGDDACKTYTVVTANTTAFETGKWYVVTTSTDITKRITVTGTANLILMDGATLNAQKGITVNNGKTLNIYAQSTDKAGALTAGNSGAGYAAIGGSMNNSGGAVNIHGGTVNATGGTSAAGIGGGQEGDGGSVAIYGGSVTATGGSGAMGIGKAVDGSQNGTLTLGTGVGMIVSTDNTNWSAYTGSNRAQYMKTGVAHTHDFTYSADGATITAACGAADCGLTDSKATLTIVAPTMTVYQETGKSEVASLTGLQDFNTATGKSLAVTNIMYVGRDGTEYTESTTAPKNAGKYTATITLSGVKTAEGDDKSVAASVDYSIKYAVTFNTNGGSAVPQQLVEAGESATRPTDPTREGNIFGGWFADADFAKRYVFNEVTENTTVHAKWGEHRVTWTVGEYSIQDVFTGNAPAADSNTTVNLAAETLKPEGATFEGWKTETDESGDVTYTAQFSFPVTLNVNGGTINAGNVESYIYGTGATLPTDVTRAKYDFGGWYANSELTGTAVTQIGTTATGSKEFWAKWTAVYAVPATVTANNRTYDGTEKPLVTVTGEATGGEMQYAIGTATEATEPYTTSIPAKTDVGTYYVWYKVVGDSNHNDTTPVCVEVTISNRPTPSGGGSSTPATVTIPVSGEGKDAETVNVTVQVTGATATVTSADVDKVLEAKDVGNVTVNVESLNKNVDEVVLPAALVEKVAKAVADNGNDASGLEIKLPTGTVTFDATTVATLAQQSNGKDLKVHLDNVSQTTLTSAQQTTVKDMNALVVLDIPQHRKNLIEYSTLGL